MCDGPCSIEEGCTGKVRPVLVYGVWPWLVPENGWEFNYCQKAVKADREKGFTVDYRDVDYRDK